MVAGGRALENATATPLRLRRFRHTQQVASAAKRVVHTKRESNLWRAADARRLRPQPSSWTAARTGQETSNLLHFDDDDQKESTTLTEAAAVWR